LLSAERVKLVAHHGVGAFCEIAELVTGKQYPEKNVVPLLLGMLDSKTVCLDM
jgi:hypothetical protein